MFFCMHIYLFTLCINIYIYIFKYIIIYIYVGRIRNQRGHDRESKNMAYERELSDEESMDVR
jgi:hypothetical protein